MLYLLVALLFLSLVVAFLVRAAWAFGLPGLLLLILIFFLIFGTT